MIIQVRVVAGAHGPILVTISLPKMIMETFVQQPLVTVGGLKTRMPVQGMVLLGLQLMVGAVFVTVMVCWQKFVSPQQSVIIQVRVVANAHGPRLVTISLP